MSLTPPLFIKNILSKSKIISISSTLLNTSIVATEALCFLNMITFVIAFNLMSESIHKKHTAYYKYGRGKGKVLTFYSQNRTLPFLKFYPSLSLNSLKF